VLLVVDQDERWTDDLAFQVCLAMGEPHPRVSWGDS
jgi:hypothetical protein